MKSVQAPWNNFNGPYAYPQLSLAEYMYNVVPREANLLKNMNPTDPRKYRLMFIGIPDNHGSPPQVGYFAGIADPTLIPHGGTNRNQQCVIRNGKTSCGIISIPPFPIG